jgi:hypothetical protein
LREIEILIEEKGFLIVGKHTGGMMLRGTEVMLIQTKAGKAESFSTHGIQLDLHRVIKIFIPQRNSALTFNFNFCWDRNVNREDGAIGGKHLEPLLVCWVSS